MESSLLWNTEGHLLWACLRDIVGSAPGHRNKVSCNLFVGGGSCLTFVKTATSMRYRKPSAMK